MYGVGLVKTYGLCSARATTNKYQRAVLSVSGVGDESSAGQKTDDCN